MKIEWNKVTRFSTITAIVLFVGMFFLGFWLGTMRAERVYVEVPHVIVRTPQQIKSGGPIVQKQDSHTKIAHEPYIFLVPRAGDSFPDATSVAVKWEPFDDSKFIYAYIMSDICTQEPCDEEYKNEGIKWRKTAKHQARDTGSFTFDLEPSSLIGKYRIALYGASEQLLAVSDSFNLDTLIGNNVGDRIGDFLISSVSEHGINTTGTTTIRGVFEEDERLGACFSVVSDDAWKIPQPTTKHLNPWFCFDNDIPNELRNSKSTTTIKIADYAVNFRATEASDRADFVLIVR